MKAFVGVILVAGFFVACTHAHPRLPRDSDESDEDKSGVDTVLVLPPGSRRQFGVRYDDSDEIDESWPTLYSPWIRSKNYFGDLYQTMNDMMRNLREQMAGILSRVPQQGMATWGKIPEGANTTSTTKIVDGHVVTINETTYVDGSDEHGTLIRIRIVDVKPQNDTILLTEDEKEAEATTVSTDVAEKESTTAARSVETVEEFDNEIPKGQVETLMA